MTRRALGLVLAVIFLVLTAFVVWSTRYRFERARLANPALLSGGRIEEPVLIRLDRFSGKVEALSSEGWIEIKPEPTAPPVVIEEAPPDFVPLEEGPTPSAHP